MEGGTRTGTHVASVDVAYTAHVHERAGKLESRRCRRKRADARFEMEKCSARKIRLRGIVSHCAGTSVS